MPPSIRGTVLMDLDGTISDPRDGLFFAFRHALASLGRTWPDDQPLDWIIGPPLRESFHTVLHDAGLATQALEHYRECYAAGAMYDNRLYPGMADAIAAIGQAGFRLYVATSKLQGFAELIIRHFGLADRFAGIYGSDLAAKREQKGDIIAHCLDQEGIDRGACVMVGDRRHDVLGASANGLACVGVTWGYGAVEELRAANAKLICDQPAALPAAVVQAIG
jgi:phosphoglycolate phosphatase